MRKTFIFLITLVNSFAFSQDNLNLKKSLQSLNAKNQSKFDLLILKADKKTTKELKEKKPALAGFAGEIPIFWESDDAPANRSANLAPLKTGTLTGLNNSKINGTGINFHIFDGGLAHTTHIEFNNTGAARAINLEATSTYSGGTKDGQAVVKSSHATNVTGIIISGGVNGAINWSDSTTSAAGDAEGILKNATTSNYLFEQTNLGTNYQKLAAANNINISNHSYGINLGWSYRTSPTTGWYWVGNYNLNNLDTYSGSYYDQDRAFDEIVYANPNQIVVKSAGNYFGDGPGSNPSIPTFKYNSSTENYVAFAPTDILPSDNCSNGYNCIGWGSLAKNIIVVGATYQLSTINNQYTSSNDVIKASFSSAGPRKDGAIKPDITAVGVDIVSPTYSTSSPTSNNRYTKGPGTSYSAPIISGIAGAVTEVNRIITGNTSFIYKADEMKALLTHTANEAGNPGPDVWYGWGFADATKAAQLVIDKKNKKAYFERNTLTSGVKFTKTITAKAGEPLKATISWIDPAAVPFTTDNDLQNNTTSRLVNDLDLRIIDTTTNTTYHPWKLNVASPMDNATKGDNTVDNVEQVLIENPVAGRTYRIEVSNKGTLNNGATPVPATVPQDYALIITGVEESSLGTAEISAEKLVTVYPTKTKDIINVLIPKGAKTIDIFDLSGKSVLKTEAKSFQTIDVSQLPKGTYIINVKTEQNVSSHKFIKE